MKTKPKIIFDRSAFHGVRFNILEKSPLKKLVNNDRIRVCHTQVFIEETLQLSLRDKNHEELKIQMPFILNLCKGGWFKDKEEIWKEEVVNNKGKGAHVFLKNIRRKNVEKEIVKFITTGHTTNLNSALAEVEINKNKQSLLHSSLNAMRNTIADDRRSNPKLKGQKLTFEQFMASDNDGKTNLIYYGQELLKENVTKNESTLNNWSNNPDNYPYFTSFVESFLYASYSAMLTNNKIDKNSCPDAELLCYLNDADIVVSWDMNFMKNAFETLWKPKNKLFFTTEEFVQYINNL